MMRRPSPKPKGAYKVKPTPLNKSQITLAVKAANDSQITANVLEIPIEPYFHYKETDDLIRYDSWLAECCKIGRNICFLVGSKKDIRFGNSLTDSDVFKPLTPMEKTSYNDFIESSGFYYLRRRKIAMKSRVERGDTPTLVPPAKFINSNPLKGWLHQRLPTVNHLLVVSKDTGKYIDSEKMLRHLIRMKRINELKASFILRRGNTNDPKMKPANKTLSSLTQNDLELKRYYSWLANSTNARNANYTGSNLSERIYRNVKFASNPMKYRFNKSNHQHYEKLNSKTLSNLSDKQKWNIYYMAVKRKKNGKGTEDQLIKLYRLLFDNSKKNVDYSTYKPNFILVGGIKTVYQHDMLKERLECEVIRKRRVDSLLRSFRSPKNNPNQYDNLYTIDEVELADRLTDRFEFEYQIKRGIYNALNQHSNMMAQEFDSMVGSIIGEVLDIVETRLGNMEKTRVGLGGLPFEFVKTRSGILIPSNDFCVNI